MRHDSDFPLTSLLINFWDTYRVYPDKFIEERMLPHIEFRGSYLLNTRRKQGLPISGGDLEHLTRCTDELYATRELMVYNYEIGAEDNDLIIRYKSMRSATTITMRFKGYLTEAELDHMHFQALTFMYTGVA